MTLTDGNHPEHTVDREMLQLRLVHLEPQLRLAAHERDQLRAELDLARNERAHLKHRVEALNDLVLELLQHLPSRNGKPTGQRDDP